MSSSPEDNQTIPMTSLFKSFLKVPSFFSSLSGYGRPPQDTDQQVDQSHEIDPEAQNIHILDYGHHSLHVEADNSDHTAASPFNSTDHRMVEYPALSSSSSSTPYHEKKKETAIALEPLPMEGPLIDDFDFPSSPRSRSHNRHFYCSGESSRSHDDTDIPSLTTSFTSSNDSFNFPSFSSPSRLPSTSFSVEATTLSTNNPDKPVSELPTVVLVTDNSPNSTNPNRLCSSNVFRKQELPRHFAILMISLIPVVMILHFTSHKRLTWGMAVAIVFVLSTSVMVLWIANLTEEDYPVHSHRIQMIGFVVAWAGIFGLVSCFVWPYPYIAVPIALWVVLFVFHGIMAYYHPT